MNELAEVIWNDDTCFQISIEFYYSISLNNNVIKLEYSNGWRKKSSRILF